VPAEAVGDVTGDLTARRGMVTGTGAAAAGWMLVRGQAPLAELATYQTRLNAMTHGEGRYTLALSHHAEVPAGVQAQLVAAFQRHEDD
jgi:elongation factor G